MQRGGCTELESRPKLARQGRGYSCAPLDCHPIFSGRCMAAPRCAPTAVLPRCVLPAPVRCVSCVPRLCASVSSSCNATPLGLDSRPRSPAPVSIECAFEVESMRSSMWYCTNVTLREGLVCGFACDSPAARRRPTRETDAQRPSARRAHTDRHTHTALDGDALSREIFLYVELDFVCPKKDAQGTVARLDLARICDRPGLHCGRARGSIADRSVRRSHRPGAHTHHARPLRSMRDISVRKRGKRMPCARHIERDCIDLEQLRTALSASTCPAPRTQRARRNAHERSAA